MARYIDGFVLVVPKGKLPAYGRIARAAAKVWRDHGALEYVECVGDDLDARFGVGFPRLAKARRGEKVVFSWIAYKSRAHRDRVTAKAMKDPRLARIMRAKAMPFDMKRTSYGGFRVLVDA